MFKFISPKSKVYSFTDSIGHTVKVKDLDYSMSSQFCANFLVNISNTHSKNLLKMVSIYS